MADFKRGNRFGGGFKKPSFNRGPSRDGGGFRSGPRRDFSSGPTERFKATCARCHKECEVPFRPNGKKPVFCKECFALTKSDSPGDSSPSFSRSYRQDERPTYRAEGNERGGDDMKSQIEILNSKLDILTRMVKELQHTPVMKEDEIISDKKVVARKSAKKASKK